MSNDRFLQPVLVTDPPLEQPDPVNLISAMRRRRQRQEMEHDNRQYEEHLFQCAMQDDEREWAIAQMCDEGTYFEPQECK